jgi:hypothetical protein
VLVVRREAGDFAPLIVEAQRVVADIYFGDQADIHADYPAGRILGADRVYGAGPDHGQTRRCQLALGDDWDGPMHFMWDDGPMFFTLYNLSVTSHWKTSGVSSEHHAWA